MKMLIVVFLLAPLNNRVEKKLCNQGRHLFLGLMFESRFLIPMIIIFVIAKYDFVKKNDNDIESKQMNKQTSNE